MTSGLRTSKSAQVAAATAVVVVIAVAAVYSFYAQQTDRTCQSSGCSSGTLPSSSGTYSLQGDNVTVVATYAGHMTEYNASTSIASTSAASTYTVTTASPTGSYYYDPNAQVSIRSVSAVVTQSGMVIFSVGYKNLGPGTIYVQGGGGSGLEASVASGTGVIMKVHTAQCLIATALVPIGAGEEHMSSTPGCWSGYAYELVHPGAVTMQLVLSWSTGTGASSQPDSITITADFTLD